MIHILDMTVDDAMSLIRMGDVGVTSSKGTNLYKVAAETISREVDRLRLVRQEAHKTIKLLNDEIKSLKKSLGGEIDLLNYKLKTRLEEKNDIYDEFIILEAENEQLKEKQEGI